MDDPYEFRPLPDASCHMRLLILIGADEASEPVECKMRVVGLGGQQPGEHIPYEALSYTWGLDVHDEPVRVDGRPLRVTRNLYHALDDDNEKSQQVREMRHIYGRAAVVVAWLGESSDPDVDAAMRFLQSPAAKSFEKLNVLDDYPLAGLATTPDGELDSVAAARELTTAFFKGALDKIGLAFPGLAKLFRKDWFSRVWVVQEVLGAKVDPFVLCGDAQASWKTTQAVALQLASDDKLKHALLPEGFLNMGVLSMTHGFPDNVYALLGLVHRSEAIAVDYRVPAALVYQRAMTTIFKTRQDLHWLAYACGAQHQQPEVPSWCVDFSNEIWLRDKLEDD
ncbi:hypothetical protein B0T24DRAFT_718397 [Lasiosphaeria ovina]|uniref:Heterokaryon incompatibility domain-containing protein n=1 Tax=Lasiosphaeria ovina TaxID=92902 RepID=A0AAE0N9N8_9PEZI|nr:hypothetical protein B0T24DRAFT_718397 [Lasiosphaeria ovina]